MQLNIYSIIYQTFQTFPNYRLMDLFAVEVQQELLRLDQSNVYDFTLNSSNISEINLYRSSPYYFKCKFKNNN